MEKFTRKLQRVSTHSYAIIIPKEIIKKLKWQERQKLDIEFDEKKSKISIKDWSPKSK